MSHCRNLLASIFLSLCLVANVSIARAQGRAPHGLAYASPVAFSPEAVDFFHPDAKKEPLSASCLSSSCSPLPMAAQLHDAQAHKGQLVEIHASRRHIGAGEITGILLGCTLAILSAMGVYYILNARRANVTRSKSVQPDA